MMEAWGSAAQVVRCFEDEDVNHVDGRVDPASDADVINLELVFADLGQIERRCSTGSHLLSPHPASSTLLHPLSAPIRQTFRSSHSLADRFYACCEVGSQGGWSCYVKKYLETRHQSA